MPVHAGLPSLSLLPPPSSPPPPLSLSQHYVSSSLTVYQFPSTLLDNIKGLKTCQPESQVGVFQKFLQTLVLVEKVIAFWTFEIEKMPIYLW